VDALLEDVGQAPHGFLGPDALGHLVLQVVRERVESVTLEGDQLLGPLSFGDLRLEVGRSLLHQPLQLALPGLVTTHAPTVTRPQQTARESDEQDVEDRPLVEVRSELQAQDRASVIAHAEAVARRDAEGVAPGVTRV